MQIMSYVTSKYTPLIQCWRGFNKGQLITDGLRPPIRHLNYHRVFSLRAHSFVWFSPSDGLFSGHSRLLRHRQPRTLKVIKTSDFALNLQVCTHENRTLLGKEKFFHSKFQYRGYLIQQVALISIPIIFIMDKRNLILFEAHESKPEDCHVKKFLAKVLKLCSLLHILVQVRSRKAFRCLDL